MAKTRWTVRVTLESSARQQVEELAHADDRSVANYLSRLVERHLREKEPS